MFAITLNIDPDKLKDSDKKDKKGKKPAKARKGRVQRRSDKPKTDES